MLQRFFLGPRCLLLPWVLAWWASTLWLLPCQGPQRGPVECSLGLEVAVFLKENLRDFLGKKLGDDDVVDDVVDDDDDDDDDGGGAIRL